MRNDINEMLVSWPGQPVCIYMEVVFFKNIGSSSRACMFCFHVEVRVFVCLLYCTYHLNFPRYPKRILYESQRNADSFLFLAYFISNETVKVVTSKRTAQSGTEISED